MRALIALVLVLAVGYAGLSALDPQALPGPYKATPARAVGAPIDASAPDGHRSPDPSNRPLASPTASNDTARQPGKSRSTQGYRNGERRWNDYLAATACMRKARLLHLADRLAGTDHAGLAEDMLRAQAAIDSDCGRESTAEQLIGLLRAAALAGHATAQMLFFSEAAAIAFGSEAEALKDPARLQRLKWQSRAYQEHAVAAVNVDAAVTLAYHLKDGFYTGRPESAAARHYFRVANRLRPSASLQAIIASMEDAD